MRYRAVRIACKLVRLSGLFRALVRRFYEPRRVSGRVADEKIERFEEPHPRLTASGSLAWWAFNIRQVGLVLMTLISLAILVVAVGGGLLGYPEMFILGNGGYGNFLNWFEPRIESTLPAVQVISISVWFYRLLMLCWALWLSFALSAG